MNIIGNNVHLVISDPWDAFRIIEGKVAYIFTQEKGVSLLIEDDQSPDKFIVSIRHVGGYILRIIDGNNIPVNVEIVTNENIACDDPEYLTQAAPYGIGSIRLSSGKKANQLTTRLNDFKKRLKALLLKKLSNLCPLEITRKCVPPSPLGRSLNHRSLRRFRVKTHNPSVFFHRQSHFKQVWGGHEGRPDASGAFSGDDANPFGFGC